MQILSQNTAKYVFAGNGLNAFELLLKRGGSSARNWGKLKASPLPRQLECSIAPEVDGGRRCGPRTSGKSRPYIGRTSSQKQQWATHSIADVSRLLTVWVPSKQLCFCIVGATAGAQTTVEI